MMNKNNLFKIGVLVLFCAWTTAILRCSLVNRERSKIFYRVKKCYRKNESIIARGNYNSFARCLNFALEKKGLAFNFSPKKGADSEDDFYFSSCEVLGCPDVENLTTLLNDSRFDYYTLYGNTEALMNASCLSTIGVFQLNPAYENYTRAENICTTTGGELAHILSETRTEGLAQILATRTLDWYKAAYIGLNDIHSEGAFVTPRGEPLDCFSYRSWAPGHPRPNRKRDDCVIIDAERTWRAVNCGKKLMHLCEIAPKPPFWLEMAEFGNGSCSDIRNRTLKRRCKKMKKKYKKAQKPVNYEEENELDDRCEDY